MALAQLIDEYLADILALRRAVAGMTRQQLVARPVPGKWSTMEVICHLSDHDPIHADRIKRVIAEDKPTLIGADENRMAALAYQDRDLAEELAVIEATRRQLARILRNMPESVLQRHGVHNEDGPLTVEQILTGVTEHVQHHVKFIEEKRRALGMPGRM